MKDLTEERKLLFQNSMNAGQYRTYRETLDYLNNTFPDKFCSVERLLKFTTCPCTLIKSFQATEAKIVKDVYEVSDGMDREEQSLRIIEENMKDHMELKNYF